MRLLLLACLGGAALFWAPLSAQQREEIVTSPDELVQVKVVIGDERITYSAMLGGKPAVLESRLGMAGWPSGKLKSATQRTWLGTWKPVYGERAVVPDNFKELTLSFERLTIYLRVYEEGFAFRYRLEGRGSFEVSGEETTFRFPAGSHAWEEYGTEGEYKRVPVGEIQEKCERPLTVEIGGGNWTALAEAAQVNYPRMLLAPDGGGGLKPWLDSAVKGTLPFETPWRVFVLGRAPGDLMERNYLLLNLNPPHARDYSWVKPGKVIREVTLSTKGGKSAVDFAVERGIDYIEYDAGWYGHEYDDASDATKVAPDPKRIASIPEHGGLDLEEVIRYARSKDVGVILYVNRRALERALKQIPLESFVYHANRNDFSRWLFARSEIFLAMRFRPLTGADTTNRSRTRVTASWSSVTCIGPRTAVPRSTGTACGRSATASTTSSPAPITPQISTRRLVVLVIDLLPRLEHGDEVQAIELAPDHKRRNDGGRKDRHRSEGVRARRDDERQSEQLGAERCHHRVREAVTGRQAHGQRRQHQDGQLAEQDVGDLAAREPDDAQRGELAAALRKRNARRVVDHAERDDGGEEDVDCLHLQHYLGPRLHQALDRRLGEDHRAHSRQRLQAGVEHLRLGGVDLQVGA
jgi:hypothetical protein